MLFTKENTVFLDGQPSSWMPYKNKFVVIANEDLVYYVDNAGGQNCIIYSHIDYNKTPSEKVFSPHEHAKACVALDEDRAILRSVNERLTEKTRHQDELIEKQKRNAASMKDFVDTARLVELSKAGYKSDDLVKLREVGIV